MERGALVALTFIWAKSVSICGSCSFFCVLWAFLRLFRGLFVEDDSERSVLFAEASGAAVDQEHG
jgi:hypothetical protein